MTAFQRNATFAGVAVAESEVPWRTWYRVAFASLPDPDQAKNHFTSDKPSNTVSGSHLARLTQDIHSIETYPHLH
jgi:hypothetical protein